MLVNSVPLGDYPFNAMAVYRPDGLGPAPVWPIEFYAAMGMKFTYERRDYDKMDLSQEPALKIEDMGIEDRVIEGKDVTPNNIMRINDRRVLIDFIGEKNYNYIFENPV